MTINFTHHIRYESPTTSLEKCANASEEFFNWSGRTVVVLDKNIVNLDKRSSVNIPLVFLKFLACLTVIIPLTFLIMRTYTRGVLLPSLKGRVSTDSTSPLTNPPVKITPGDKSGAAAGGAGASSDRRVSAPVPLAPQAPIELTAQEKADLPSMLQNAIEWVKEIKGEQPYALQQSFEQVIYNLQSAGKILAKDHLLRFLKNCNDSWKKLMPDTEDVDNLILKMINYLEGKKAKSLKSSLTPDEWKIICGHIEHVSTNVLKDAVSLRYMGTDESKMTALFDAHNMLSALLRKPLNEPLNELLKVRELVEYLKISHGTIKAYTTDPSAYARYKEALAGFYTEG